MVNKRTPNSKLARRRISANSAIAAPRAEATYPQELRPIPPLRRP